MIEQKATRTVAKMCGCWPIVQMLFAMGTQLINIFVSEFPMKNHTQNA